MNQIDGTPVYQISWHTLEPLIENNKLSIRAAAVSFQNLGEQDVKVNHHWTIQAGGGTLHIGDEKSTNILVQEFQIQFSGTGTRYLEISELRLDHPIFAHYKEQDNG